MKLQCEILIKSEYSGKSKFNFWNELQIKDIIEISTPFKNIRNGRSGVYSPILTFKNIRTGHEFSCAFNEGFNYLSKVSYEERI